MAIKISDLSVGDWVRYDGRDYQVKSIHGDFERVTLIGNKEQRDESIYAIQPIPITAEILEKNGFVRRSADYPIYEYTTLLGKMLRTTMVNLHNPYDYIFCRIENTAKELHEDGRCLVSSNVNRHPIYVHDLQHVLRLAGMEKEIYL